MIGTTAPSMITNIRRVFIAGTGMVCWLLATHLMEVNKHLNTGPSAATNLTGDNCSRMTSCPSVPDYQQHVTRVLVLVNSAPNNTDFRSAIRETWGREIKQRNDTMLFFFVGDGNLITRETLKKENRLYGDVVIVNFVDTYFNLTRKSLLLLCWARDRFQRVKFVLKIDDDVFLNVPKFNEAVADLTARNWSRFGVGRLASGWAPIRDNSSKYYISELHYPSNFYPNFLSGPAYLLSYDSLTPLLLASDTFVNKIHLEDVFVTGLCAEKAGVKRIDHPLFTNIRYYPDMCQYMKLITVHDVNPGELRLVWNDIKTHGIRVCESYWKSEME